jgi:LPXTG-motif cell wall-anchored protein
VGKVAKGPVPPSGNDGMKCALSASAFAAPTAGLPNTGVSSAGKIGLAATGLAFLGAGAAFILLRRNERERRIDQLNARLR